MVKLFDDVNIKAIADAIRAKNGTTNTYKTSEMASAILELSGGDLDAVISRSITEINSNVTYIGDSAFLDCKSLTSATFPNVTEIANNGFDGCSKLRDISFPQLTTTGTHVFYNCDRLRWVVFPELTKVNSYMFASCDYLTIADFPKATSIGNNAFYLDFILEAVILRSNTLCTLSNKNAFSKCYHILGEVDENYNPNGLADGYIYVPSALVDSYKADSVWSNFSTQIRALEDYTVDGTTTGELDESKI